MLPKRPRLKIFDYVGPHRYFLTFCTRERRSIFTTADAVDLVLQQILRAASETAFVIIAYCFMPDHVHLLIEGTAPDSDLEEFCKLAKQYAGFYYKQRYHESLWQPSFDDRVLRDDEGTWSVARYIVNNPLREGLATRADEYPFLGSCVVGKRELLEFVAAAADWKWHP